MQKRRIALQVVEVALDCIDGYVAARAQDLRSISIGRRAERLADVEQVQAQVRSAVLLQQTPVSRTSSLPSPQPRPITSSPTAPARSTMRSATCPIGIAMRAGGVGILLGNRAPRRSAVVIQIQERLLDVSTAAVQQHRHLAMQLQGIEPGASQQLGANSAHAWGGPRGVHRWGWIDPRSGTDCRCISVVRVGDDGLFFNVAQRAFGDPATLRQHRTRQACSLAALLQIGAPGSQHGLAVTLPGSMMPAAKRGCASSGSSELAGCVSPCAASACSCVRAASRWPLRIAARSFSGRFSTSPVRVSMVCANSVRTGIASVQFHRSFLVRRLLTRLGARPSDNVYSIHLLTCPWSALGQSRAQVRSRVCGHLRGDVCGPLCGPLPGPLRCR